MAKSKFAQENQRLQESAVEDPFAIYVFTLTSMTALTLYTGETYEFIRPS